MTAFLLWLKTPLGSMLARWAAILALIASTAFAFAVHERNFQQEKDDAKYAEERKEQARVNAEAIAKLDAKYRALEAKSKADLQAIGEKHEQDLKDAKARRDRDVAAARAGALRLSIPSNCPNPDRSSMPNAGPSASLGDAEARTDLPPEITASLFAIADDADELVGQLTACQAVVEADRKILQPRKEGDP